ncbi:hypothetical protein [Pseudodesulfovibrio piezophilus]|uniref:Lipoprotein n=1 Tax=Pseudodesulfovibrio piezophilus (strain DSM 21447 / JCM 15486 / C1TLV30) TaxID=1322246 RepID=M1WMC2_PSEP2|nr:hypothetical protein [Pseudodesulfovibrio piezophilus]CCH49350.1 conserved exported protein of unknown function [Pseudodesulfovibrio piezophilus C1TLV30]
MRYQFRIPTSAALLLTFLLLLTLVACAGKEDAPIDGGDTPAGETSDTETQATSQDQSSQADQEDDDAFDVQAINLDPLGDIRLVDGTVLELTQLEPIGKYYVYLSGKLNDRSSTVISLTRIKDLRRWKSITFPEPRTVVITTRDEKELKFTSAALYFGNDSYDTYTFRVTPPGSYQSEITEVKKKDVIAINFNPLKNQ